MKMTKWAAMAAGVLALATASAQADTIHIYIDDAAHGGVGTGVTDIGGGFFRWDYIVTLTSGSALSAADNDGTPTEDENANYVTFYDFKGWDGVGPTFDGTGGATVLADWSISNQKTGFTDTTLAGGVNDSAAHENFTWIWNGSVEGGSELVYGVDCPIGGIEVNFDCVLFRFSLVSSIGSIATVPNNVSSVDHKVTAGKLAPGHNFTVSDVATPGPEPSVLLLMGSGLLGAAALRRRKAAK